MADPLSVTTAVVTLLGTASAAGKALKKLASLRNAPAQVLQLNNEVADLEAVLTKARHSVHEWEHNSTQGNPEDQALFSRQLERAENPLNQLKDFLTTIKAISPATGSSRRGAGAGYSKRAWVRYGSKVAGLTRSLRQSREEIDEMMTMLCATQISQMRTEVRNITMTTLAAEAIINNTQYESGQQIAELSTTVSAILPTMRLVQQQLQKLDRKSGIALPKHADSSITEEQAQNVVVQTPSLSSMPVCVETAVMQPGHCPVACSCRCHKMSIFRYPSWAQGLVGSLFVGYSGIPLLSQAKCSEQSCQRDKRCLVKVSYFFPTWLLSRMVFWQHSWDFLQGHDPFWRTPRVIESESELFLLAQKGSIKGLQGLFSAGTASIFDVNNLEGRSAMHYAVTGKQPEMCLFLMSHGADPRVEDKFSLSPVDVVWNYLLQDDSTLHEALTAAFKPYMHDSDGLCKRGFSPIHRIIFCLSSVSLETYLSLTTAEIDSTCSLGRTALFWAAIRQDAAPVRTLLKYGADLSIPDRRQQAPLHVVSAYGRVESLELLLNAAAVTCGSQVAPNVRDNMGMDSATRLLPEPAVLASPKFKKLIEVRDFKGRTPLHGTAHGNKAPHARLLLQYGADVNSLDATLGRTSLLLCIYWNHHEAMQVLLEHGARADLPDLRGRSILHYAAEYGDIRTLNVLTEAKLTGVTADAVDEKGRTAAQLFAIVREQSTTMEESAVAEMRVAFQILLSSVEPTKNGGSDK